MATERVTPIDCYDYIIRGRIERDDVDEDLRDMPHHRAQAEVERRVVEWLEVEG